MIKNGFTLIEMLVVISIFSILLVLALPHQSQTLKHQVEQRFIDQLEQDVLFIQNQSALTRRQRLEIKFQDDHYQIFDHIHANSSKRFYPKNWKIIRALSRNIRFTVDGTLLQPQTIVMQSETERISLVFPFGKGRLYIEREKRVLDD